MHSEPMTFCENCGCERKYGITWSHQKRIQKGYERKYTAYRTWCLRCGNEVFVPYLDIINLRNKLSSGKVKRYD